MGMGLGVPYDEVEKGPDISSIFALYLHIPNNSVLWMLAAFGPLGFLLVLSPLGLSAYYAARAHASAVSWVARLGAVASLAGIFGFVLQAWGDMGTRSWTTRHPRQRGHRRRVQVRARLPAPLVNLTQPPHTQPGVSLERRTEDRRTADAEVHLLARARARDEPRARSRVERAGAGADRGLRPRPLRHRARTAHDVGLDGLRVVDARALPAEARPELLAKLSNTDRAVVLVDCPEQSVLATLLCASADALLLLAHQDDGPGRRKRRGDPLSPGEVSRQLSADRRTTMKRVLIGAICAAALCACGPAEKTQPPKPTQVSAADPAISYEGRFEWASTEGPLYELPAARSPSASPALRSK